MLRKHPLGYINNFYGYAPTKTGALIPYLVKGVFEKRSHRQGNPCEYALRIKLSENKANLGSLNRDGGNSTRSAEIAMESKKSPESKKLLIFSKNFLTKSRFAPFSSGRESFSVN